MLPHQRKGETAPAGYFGQELDRMAVQGDPDWAQYDYIPAWYTISIDLDGDVGASQAGSVPIRPEPFLCFRITWATTGDTRAVLSAMPLQSIQGRSVEILWGDEFTRFMGNIPCLLSAVFGDSNGYLDIPHGLQFQGRQSLTATLTRILWPDTSDPVTVRFDLCFQGVGVLPKGTYVSGSPR